MKYPNLIIAFWLLLQYSPATCPEGADRTFYPLTAEIKNKFAEALKTHPLILSTGLNAQSAELTTLLSSSLPDPQLTLSLNIPPMEQLTGNEVGSIQIMQMFPWFGTNKYRGMESIQMAKAQKQDALNQVLTLSESIHISWLELVNIQNRIHLLNELLGQIPLLEKLAQKSYSLPENPASSLSAVFVPGEGIPAPPEMYMPAGTRSSTGKNRAGMPGMAMGSPTPSTPTLAASGFASGTKVNTSGQMEGMEAEMGNTNPSNLDIQSLNGLIQLKQNHDKLLTDKRILEETLRFKKATLNNLLGRPLNQNFELPPPFPLNYRMYSADSSVLTDSLKDTSASPGFTPFCPVLPVVSQDSLTYYLNQHPSMEALRLEEAAAETRMELAKKMTRPMLGLGLGYTLFQKNDKGQGSMNGMDMLMPMASMTLPLFTKKNRATRTQARIESKILILNQKSALNDLHLRYQGLLVELEKHKYLYHSSLAQLELEESSLKLQLNRMARSQNQLVDVFKAYTDIYNTKARINNAYLEILKNQEKISHLIKPFTYIPKELR